MCEILRSGLMNFLWTYLRKKFNIHVGMSHRNWLDPCNTFPISQNKWKGGLLEGTRWKLNLDRNVWRGYLPWRHFLLMRFILYNDNESNFFFTQTIVQSTKTGDCFHKHYRKPRRPADEDAVCAELYDRMWRGSLSDPWEQVLSILVLHILCCRTIISGISQKSACIKS